MDKNVIVLITCYKKLQIFIKFLRMVLGGGSWIDHVVYRGGWPNDHVWPRWGVKISEKSDHVVYGRPLIPIQSPKTLIALIGDQGKATTNPFVYFQLSKRWSEIHPIVPANCGIFYPWGQHFFLHFDNIIKIKAAF